MKDIEQIEELLNCYIDGELDERKSNEVKRLIDNDKEILSLYDSLTRYKNLMNAVSKIPAPETLCDNITSQLEREILLADTDTYSHKAGRRHLMLRRVLTAAAVVALAAVLSFVIFDIFVPKSSRQQFLSAAMRKKPVKEVLYEKPFAETASVQQDAKIVPQKSYNVPFLAVLTLKTNTPIEVDWLVAKALNTTDLFRNTSAIERQPKTIKYVINCDNQSLANLMQELSFIWPQCTETQISIGTEQAGKYITIDNISARQAMEICKAENSTQRLRMANDLAIINRFTSPAILDRLYATADIEYDMLASEKPALASTEKTQIVSAAPDIKDTTLTIIVVTNN